MAETMQRIAVDDLMPDVNQPRQTFNSEALERLAMSIAKVGIQQPLRVLWDAERKCWLILTGESRWRAAKLAGLTHVPCIVIEGELSDADRLADRLTENMLRDDLPPMEEAAGVARLKALKGCNSKTLVEEYGFTPASITRMESLLKLPPSIQQMVGNGPGMVPPSAAYEISRLEDPQAQMELASAVAGRRMSRDGVAEAVRNRVGRRNVKPKGAKLPLRLDGGISVTVSAGQPLTWQELIDALDQIRKQAKKLCDDGKEVQALARMLRAS
jgi:ParB family transcriptional regulator, chromosome partitioning protein